MIRVFFSYSHADENYRNELEKHLMSLKHQGIIESWHDRRIVAGEEWANRIDDELRKADIILLLVSSDFIASRYCYELEMTEALARHDRREAVVIPVILRPCHWTGLPFGKLQAATRDGRPVEKYPSLDDAFLEITQGIEAIAKRISTSSNSSPAMPAAADILFGKAAIATPATFRSELPRSSNLAISKTFSDHDRDTFVTDAFHYMASFFENSLKEIQDRNPEINIRFQKVDARSFEAIIYRNGKQISKCGIWLGAPFGSSGLSSIIYSYAGLGQGNSFNESMSVKDTGNMLGLEPMGMGISNLQRADKGPLTHQGAAEYYWSMFFEPVKRG
ncbi:toll/interleukin-1 receptor domain-containing protein [Methylomonas rapida]|uniref:Toll/interleukin-1 receptor domain-containing protein n=1 Tax=Methylomonas rapida TaxID=2963939 RepID=A0ABY7GFT7_9GAMM|nr:toll/interleukin-1 receptor domain-containing protein [Methylomonas rapida]WAR43341.1 toll/interleukin-1 receptor domain-containing protein [Methylomonas rapida]